jgi:Cu/Ag efflux pump CusA
MDTPVTAVHHWVLCPTQALGSLLHCVSLPVRRAVMQQLPLDATPDLSETQVIILSRWDRSPDIIED